MSRPTLETERLILRPFQLSDAKDVQRLAGHELIAATTATVPHPYKDGMAEEWINQHEKRFNDGTDVQFCITLKSTQEVIGCIDLFTITRVHQRAEMGYWVGVDHWGKGYCTEAAQAIAKYAFNELKLNKLIARHMATNPASGKVMTKIGMTKEGYLRQQIVKNSRFVDMVEYGLLKDEYNAKIRS